MTAIASSYVHGASDTPFISETIGAHFDRAVDRWPDRDALVVRQQGIHWNYSELKERVDACAAGLLSLGLEPGDRVGIWSPNRSEWVVTQFATAKAGLILVNINPAYRVTELEYALNKVECRALITATEFKSSDYLEMLRLLAPEIGGSVPGKLEASTIPSLTTVVHLGNDAIPGLYSFDQLLQMGEETGVQALERLAPLLQFDNPINIQFTSGTTGAPKGATLTHHNILNNGFFVGELLGLTERDRVCIPVPLYHCFGMVVGNLASLTHGSTMVYASDGFDAAAVLQAIEAERCTVLYGVPTMFIAELEHPEFSSFDLTSLRTGIMAGSPCPIEVMKRVVDEMHMAEVGIAYGMTETSPASFQTLPTDPLDRRVSTVGRIHPHVEAKVIDDAGRIVPRGVPGELCTRGYMVMLGYWGDTDQTKAAVDATGWMHTGDLATIDGEGFCNIVGRIKDMIVRGGENVYPKEVEDFIYTNSKVEAVHVVGVPDAKYGEQLCAWVKLRDGESATEDDIRDFCKGQIAHYKVPYYVKFVDTFPMTVTGKVQKFIMRKKMIDELGLQEQETA